MSEKYCKIIPIICFPHFCVFVFIIIYSVVVVGKSLGLFTQCALCMWSIATIDSSTPNCNSYIPFWGFSIVIMQCNKNRDDVDEYNFCGKTFSIHNKFVRSQRALARTYSKVMFHGNINVIFNYCIILPTMCFTPFTRELHPWFLLFFFIHEAI